MIIEEYDESLFISRFEDYKRVETSKNPNGNFSYNGLRALFNYLDDTTDEENPYKLDVIALCCEFSEYKNMEEYLKDYSNQHTEKENFKDFVKENNLKLIEEYEKYKKESIKNGLNLAESFFNWVGIIKKEEDIINQFEATQEAYLNIIWEEIQDKTSIILLGDDLNDGFIIAQF